MRFDGVVAKILRSKIHSHKIVWPSRRAHDPETQVGKVSSLLQKNKSQDPQKKELGNF